MLAGTEGNSDITQGIADIPEKAKRARHNTQTVDASAVGLSQIARRLEDLLSVYSQEDLSG